jgi:hypothetical protein
VINLNALLRRRVEYYEYPWAIEGHLLSAQSQLRSLFQASDVGFIFSKSMPRSGHRFLTECLTHYFGPELHYCGFYRPGCCHRMPCARPHGDGSANRYFMQKSHDAYFINFYRKWVAAPRLNALAVAYEDLIGEQARTLAAVVSFIQGDSSLDQAALARALAEAPVGADGGAGKLRDPMQHVYCDPVLFAQLEHRIAKECGKDRIRFHFI